MKIINRIGDFVIKETNEREKNRGFTGGMDNYYIYEKKNSSVQLVDHYVDTAESLDEALLILSSEQIKKDFDIVNFIRRIAHGKISEWELQKELDDLKIPYKIIKKWNSIYEVFDYIIKFEISEYSMLTTAVIRMKGSLDQLCILEVIGVYGE